MKEINCPQCRGCKDHTENCTCRETCFSFKVAEAKDARQKEKREKIRSARQSERIYKEYKKDAIHRMKKRDWHREYTKRGKHT